MQEIVLNISIVAILTALIKFIVPENNKQMQFLISCFFIASTILFITNGKINMPENGTSATQSYNDYTASINEATKQQIGKEMAERVRKMLNEADISVANIYITVNIVGTSCISIEEIVLEDVQEEKTGLATALVESETHIRCSIKEKNGNN